MPPLHLYLERSRNVNVDTVCFLVDCHPEALMTVDSIGRLPLHVACRWGHDLGVIGVLFEIAPKAAFVKTLTWPRSTPLTITSGEPARYLRRQLNMVEEIVGNSTSAEDATAGRFLLHRALRRNGFSLGAFKLLADKVPAALHQVDDEGLFSLHVARRQGAMAIAQYIVLERNGEAGPLVQLMLESEEDRESAEFVGATWLLMKQSPAETVKNMMD